jgi:hypothetical protein
VRDPGRERFELPLLYLHRDGAPTPPAERTLTLRISGLPGGSEVRLQAQSLHRDVETGTSRIATWDTRVPDRPCVQGDPCIIEWTLDPATTPSDLYTLRINTMDGETLWESLGRPAFVALDSWDVRLGDYAVRVYYATLFPFARGQNDLDNRLAPHQVSAFIENVLLPITRETWQTQFVEWGFGASVHPQWDSDNLIELVITDPPYALFGGTGTYASFTGYDGRPSPERRIWWLAANNSFQAYDTLENACKAVFAHEFFHLMQWNTLLSTGRPTDLWISWIEGQGRFAPTVQYPELELSCEHLVMENSAYASGANRFLALHLNTSYNRIEIDRGNKYDSAVYWRFLYEQYGDMDIVRAALEEMPNHFNSDTVGGMKSAMDAALARVDGPFHSFEESLVAFARANYGLRLENAGMIASGDGSQAALLWDPDGIYVDPPLAAELRYTDAPLRYAGTIGASYGMDFVEIGLDRSVHGQPLTLRFQAKGSAARFHVRVWQLRSGLATPRAVTAGPDQMTWKGDGTHELVIQRVDILQSNRLAVIITRLDPHEALDVVGAYHLTLESTSQESVAGQPF